MRGRGVILGMLAAAALAGPAAGQARLTTPNGIYTMGVVSWRDMPFRTVVRQQYDFSCGSAAVATLLTYHYGRPTTEREAFQSMYASGDQAKIRKVGFSMLDMKRFLTGVGFKAEGYRMDVDGLAKVGSPAIALIQLGAYRHFVVVKGVHPDAVLIGDPAQGARIMSRADFQKAWNGIAFGISAPGEQGSFNREAEWQVRPGAPWGAGLQILTNEALTRELAPLYQITPTIRVTLPGQ